MCSKLIYLIIWCSFGAVVVVVLVLRILHSVFHSACTLYTFKLAAFWFDNTHPKWWEVCSFPLSWMHNNTECLFNVSVGHRYFFLQRGICSNPLLIFIYVIWIAGGGLLILLLDFLLFVMFSLGLNQYYIAMHHNSTNFTFPMSFLFLFHGWYIWYQQKSHLQTLII